MDKNWFDLRPQFRRSYAQAVWIPLSILDGRRQGNHGTANYRQIFEGAHSIAVPLDKRDLGERYSWSDNSDPRPWAEPGFYKAADVYCHNAETDVGFRLVLRQSVAGQPHAVWHLHQDFVIALDLLREGNSWVRPAEGYIEVARLRHDDDGKPIGIEVRAEFLQDYLCARNSALRIASYRNRDAILEELGDIDFPKEGRVQEVSGGRLEERAWAIDGSGSPFGSSVGVFKVARNDVDAEADVPTMGPETNDNVDATSWSFTRDHGKLWRVMSEFWRDEWIEPAVNSPRVRRDHVPSQVTYVVEADGRRMNADELDDEDIGRWLWFSPGIVASLLSQRGSRLEWYTRDTGGLSTPSNTPVHFGINESGLITVYAHDVARLPEWERRLWSGFNVSPEGKVSAELLSAQVRTEVADSQAPEPFLGIVLRQLGEAWQARFGTSLIRTHDQADEILARTHRFRSLDRPGLLSLAKEVARLTADSIDAAAAQKVAPPPKDEKHASLKSLERALAAICGDALAHKAVGPLFAAYDLRLSDAHLPRSDLLNAFTLLGISEDDPHLTAGYKLLQATVSALNDCTFILRGDFPGAPAKAPAA